MFIIEDHTLTVKGRTANAMYNQYNIIKIRSPHLFPIFYRMFCSRPGGVGGVAMGASTQRLQKQPIENREQIRRSNFN
jgi:hypothetical protein